MNILHITCSPRGADSASTRLSRFIVDAMLASASGGRVTERDLGRAPLPPVDADYAWSLAGRLDADESHGTLKWSDLLIGELEAADRVVIGTPMHNFTVPATLKTWIDHVVRIRRTFQSTPDGKVGTLPDRPVLVAIASGGHYAGDLARQPDFLTPYLMAILETIGLHDVTCFSLQGMTRGGAEAVWDRAVQAVRAYLDTRRGG